MVSALISVSQSTRNRFVRGPSHSPETAEVCRFPLTSGVAFRNTEVTETNYQASKVNDDGGKDTHADPPNDPR